MLIAIEESGVPVYRQIVEQVRFQVAGGLLAAGVELPSTRALSQELGVNPMTVSKAYGLLEAEGLVVRRPGLPLVVSDRAGTPTRQQRRQQLRELLEPAALAARQLDVEEEEAVDLFRRLLKQGNREGAGR